MEIVLPVPAGKDGRIGAALKSAGEDEAIDPSVGFANSGRVVSRSDFPIAGAAFHAAVSVSWQWRSA
jgi:hypothetical protein